MKGKVSKLYFNAPNIAKVRSRLENPSAEFSAKMRVAINDAICEVINENTIALRAKLIDKFFAMGEQIRSEKDAKSLANVLGSFFDVTCSNDNVFPGGAERAKCICEDSAEDVEEDAEKTIEEDDFEE